MFFHYIFWKVIFFGWIFKFLFIVFIIWLIINSLSRNRSSRDIKLQSQSALDILKTRYAKGEISKEQFEQMRKDLE